MRLIVKGQNIAKQGNWTLAIEHHPWHTTDLTPKGTDNPTVDKKSNYSNGRKCQKYKHETKKWTL